MPTYNKLVRDRIPEIIKQSGSTFRTRILDDTEYIEELKSKVQEELKEYLETQSDKEAIDELVDLIEVINALANIHGASEEQLNKVRQHKAGKRGKFEKRIFLIDVED
ncbi:MAG TPA: nucleoside triphosphate pyrophosphohydrolase [Bacillus sp. (in: firmicutes)]|nr:nucleoside triphosphate pyrophosphohydrolase [Bacillus sp. (in: firmicutes)]